MPADTLSLAGKVAIVTGSAREKGIGAAIALALARNGASVTINHVSDSSATRAAVVAKRVEEAGGKAVIVQADLDSPQGAKKLVQETLKAFGTDHIDILVNNAAYGYYGGTMETTPDELERVMRTNVMAPLYVVQATVPRMPRGGRIINLSSCVSKMGWSFMPAYAATKAAIDSLTYAWAEEFGRSNGITVNAVAPGPVTTDMMVEDPEANPGIRRLLDATRAERRMGEVEDLADAVLLLVQEKSRWITGQYINVSGGIVGQ